MPPSPGTCLRRRHHRFRSGSGNVELQSGEYAPTAQCRFTHLRQLPGRDRERDAGNADGLFLAGQRLGQRPGDSVEGIGYDDTQVAGCLAKVCLITTNATQYPAAIQTPLSASNVLSADHFQMDQRPAA